MPRAGKKDWLWVLQHLYLVRDVHNIWIVLGSQEVVSSRKSLSYCSTPTSWAGLHDAALLGSHASCVGPQVLAVESDAGIIPTNPV